MTEVIRCTGLPVRIAKAEVFRDLDCTQKSAAYEVFEKEYRELLETAAACCHPAAWLKECRFPEGIPCKGLRPGERILCVLYTIGREVSACSTEAFLQGDYVKGMLLNAMADAALFAMEQDLEPVLKDFCREQGVGIRGRYHASDPAAMPLQRFLYEELEGAKNGFLLSAGCMLDPVKSNTMILGLTEDRDAFCAHHSCSGCGAVSCKRKKTTIFQN